MNGDNQNMNNIYLLFFLLLLSYLFTWAVKCFSVKKNIIDIPNNRSSHSSPTPRGGGLAIVISWYAGLSWLFIEDMIKSDLYFSLISGSILAIISFIDDIFDLKPILRLISQSVTVIISIYFIGGINDIQIKGMVLFPSYIITPIAAIGFVWFINLYNFLDGIDGYASFEAISISTALYFITGDIINAILISCIIGFLIWNWPKAKIFMGDVGSTQLGFILLILGIYYHNEGQLSILWWIILTSPFWFDATFTLFLRWKNNEKLSQAHKKHIYQRLVQSGFSHLQVDILLVIVNLLLITNVLIFKDNENMQIILLFLSPIFMYLIAFYTERKCPFLTDSYHKK